MIYRCFPATHGAFELHITRANYQAKIWLQTDYAIIYLENKHTETFGWQEGKDGLEVVWKCLFGYPRCVHVANKLRLQDGMCLNDMQAF